MRIAILYICTGKYSIFWDAFYFSCEQHFYPGEEKTYFVFTDDEDLIKRFKDEPLIHPYFQRRAGWPYDTLMRFNSFAMVQDMLISYDYCYFWNANAVFLKTVDESVIPLPTKEKEMLLWRHTIGYDYERPEQFNAEKNPESEAYVPQGSLCRSYGGGFFGGTSEGFVRMSIVLRDRVARDLEKGLIATQHDQSHIVKYGTEVECVEVPKDVVVSEEYMDGRDPYVIFTNKQHVGGMHKLREMPLSFRLKEKIINALRSVASALGVKSIMKELVGKKNGKQITENK